MTKPDSSEQQRRTRLLAETFHEDWDHGELAGHARLAARRTRRRHHLRRSLLAVGTAAALAAMLALGHRRGQASVPVAPPASPAPAYEIISDDELLARMPPDQPLLAVRHADGTRQFTLLKNTTGDVSQD
jgi:hypothetical protein